MQGNHYPYLQANGNSNVPYEAYSQYLPQQVVDQLNQQEHQFRKARPYTLQRFPSYNSVDDAYHEDVRYPYYDHSNYYGYENYDNQSFNSSNMALNRNRKMSRSNSHESFNNTQVSDKFRLLPCRTFISTGTCPYGDKCVFLHDPRVTSTKTWIRGKLRKPKEESTVDSFFWTPMLYEEVCDKLDDRRQPHVSQEFIIKRPDKATFGKGAQGKYTAREFKTAMAVYSMWSYFLEFNVKLQERADGEEEAKRQVQTIQSGFVSAYSRSSQSWAIQSTGPSYSGIISSRPKLHIDHHPPTPRSILQADWSPYSEESWDNDPCDEMNKHTGRRRLTIFVHLSQGRTVA